jgi:translocation and assembly module TamA
MGTITFTQAPQRIIRDTLVEGLVYWKAGEYYHQGRLDRLRKSLVALDYFSRIVIEPRPDAAVDGQVPVTVTLVPARPSVYTAGLSYGTDSGAGVRLGLERRYLNDRGHKLLAQIDWAQKRKTATVQYRIPAFVWLDGWYAATLQGNDEQTDFADTRRLELIGSRSGEVTERWTATVGLHALRERWLLFRTRPTPLPGLDPYSHASLVFPSLEARYIDTDDRLYPRAGFGGSALLRAGLQALGADANFAQVHVQASWFRGLDARSRLLLRGEAGYTFTGDLVEMPLSLRYFAGGNRSIRGYQWREVGPRFGEFALGAKSVLTGSVEYERFVAGPWGFAAFVDSGSAFDDTPDWHTGIGVGLRWRSPVGPVRIDLAHGMNNPQSPITLYLNIGPDL